MNKKVEKIEIVKFTPVLVVIAIKHPPVFKGQYLLILSVHFNNKLTCSNLPPKALLTPSLD